ncbi:MAG: hypothetical protein HUU35_07470, partial [Armatimonadetes bacterium]|nr:hypothetical protein [Armatimonadota bacterium]
MTIPWLLLASLAPAPALPPKILSAYAGYWLDNEPETAWFERYVAPFAAAGFTCLEFKIHPASFDLADPLQQRRLARLAHEVTSRGLVVITGEITTRAKVDYQSVARSVIQKIGYDDPEIGFDHNSCAVLTAIGTQSPDIAMGVNTGGAGDQGLMFGYA